MPNLDSIIKSRDISFPTRVHIVKAMIFPVVMYGAGKDGGLEEKGATEDVMIRLHHLLNGHEFEQTPGSNEGTRNPEVLQSMRLQRVRHNLATEQQQQQQ